MADDIFGDDELFAEFDRERDQQSIFINYELDASGTENRSRIVFKDADSEYDESDDEYSTTPTTAEPGASTEPIQNDETQTTENGNENVAVEPKGSEEGIEVDTDQVWAPQTTSHQEQFESILYNELEIIE
jgi:hypothetical protein